MADVSEAAWVRVQEIFDYEPTTHFRLWKGYDRLASYIQQVSDAAADITKHGLKAGMKSALSDFILPEPVDPVVAALKEANEGGGCTYQDWANALPDALAKRGLKIVSSDA